MLPQKGVIKMSKKEPAGPIVPEEKSILPDTVLNEQQIIAAQENVALSVADKLTLEEIRKEGGAGDVMVMLPSLKMEHTTDRDGNPNNDKGQFSISTRDEMGEWHKELLGEQIECQIVLQRYTLALTDGDKRYSSPEFDNTNDIIKLYESIGQGDDRKNSLYAEGNVNQLSQKFMVTKNNRTFSELKLLYVLYLQVNGQLVKWRTNMSATMAYRKYQKETTPFAVKTLVTREEMQTGTVKFYSIKFKPITKLTNFAEILEAQRALRTSLQGNAVQSYDEEEPSNRGDLSKYQSQ